jgi:catalase
VLRDKVFHFDHERIPERVVHARGYGAHGFFEPFESLSDLTRADLFQRPGERTPVFVRFSTVAGNKGSADLARDVRGFAVKFYTQEGNWDLVGNNIPVFFIQDAMKFPDLIHSVKDEPDRGFPQAASAHDNFWDFASLMPETTHMLTWVMSDRAIPRSFRFMEGFGVHTFRFVNRAGDSTFVKFHWKPKLGMQSVVWNEAVKINGADPDFHRRDLWNAIQSGDFPEWELGIQVFDDAFADAFDFDVLDATKLIPEEILPIRRVGRLVLDRVVDNFFAETEQAAFCTNNVVPGIDFTNDPLLQGRNFSYLDTQLKRLGGPNFTHLPINAPKCPFATFQQDGHMAMLNPVGRANYEPNSWAGDARGPREDPVNGYESFAAPEGGEARRVRAELFADHYSQARLFYSSQTATEQTHIADAFVFELSKVERLDIRVRMVANLRNVDEDLAAAVADGLGLAELPPPSTPARQPITDLAPSPALSILTNSPATFAGRKLGILVTDGTDARLLAALTAAAEAEGAVVELIAPKIGGVVASDRTLHLVHQKIDGGPSVLYDAVAIIPSPKGVAMLASHAAAKDFVNDAHAHCKFVGYGPGAQPLFDAAGLSELMDDGYVALDAKKSTATNFIKTCRQLRHWARESTVKTA